MNVDAAANGSWTPWASRQFVRFCRSRFPIRNFRLKRKTSWFLRKSIPEEEGADATEEEAAVLEELPPQAASRPAAPTTPVTFMKSRREIALLIFVLLLKMIKNIVLHGGSAHTPLYTIMITKGGQKRKTQIVVMQLKNVQILLCFPHRI